MDEVVIFYCKKCKKDIEVSLMEAKGMVNWKCVDCETICMKKGSNAPAVIWNCSKGGYGGFK
jgi:DNA replicative helicase MCM subunit Mcm2 (Cdc46/Mcm family)